jgi:hypothetical protein
MANTLLLKDGPSIKLRVVSAQEALTELDGAIVGGSQDRIANKIMELGDLLFVIGQMLADGIPETE